MRQQISFIILSLLSLSARAEVPFQGGWQGTGKSLVNGVYQDIEIILNVMNEQVLQETITGGFRATSLNFYRLKDEGAFLWEDYNGNKIGSGDCQNSLCTFTGTSKVGSEMYAFNKVYHLTGDSLIVSQSISGQDYVSITNIILRR